MSTMTRQDGREQRQRVNYRALQGHAPRPHRKALPLRKGGWCVYKRSSDTRPLEILAIVGGVAKVSRDGRAWEEAMANLRAIR